MSIENEEPGSERWWREFEQLDPQTQDNVLYDMEYEQATDTPWSFGESSAPELSYPNYDLMQMSGGFDIPELTSKGAVDPFDLTQQGKRQTVAKGYGAALLDNILTGMAGPGAYDPRAFTPTYEYGDPLNMVGQRKAQTMANQGGYLGFIADRMLNNNESYAEAEAAMWNVVETPDDDPELTKQDRDLKQSILSTLPSAPVTNQPVPPSGGRGGVGGRGAQAPDREGRLAYDQELVRSEAKGLWDALMEDPEYGYEENGRFYEREPEMIKTPQMEFFDQYGIPYPTASYEDPQYLQDELDVATGMDAFGREQQAAGFDQRMGQLDRRVNAASQQYQGANKANQALQSTFAGGPGALTSGGAVATNRAGDTVPYDFAKPPDLGASWTDMVNPFSQRDTPVTRRGTQKDLDAQGKRRQDASLKVQRQSHAREAAKYRDPRLVDLEMKGKLWALAQQGRTPFNDAVALRQQGLRAQGL